MVKKFSAILFALVLCVWTTPVHAAPTELPLSLSNSWTIAKDGGGLFVYHTLHRKL